MFAMKLSKTMIDSDIRFTLQDIAIPKKARRRHFGRPYCSVCGRIKKFATVVLDMHSNVAYTFSENSLRNRLYAEAQAMSH